MMPSVDWEHVVIMMMEHSMSVNVKMEPCSMEATVTTPSHVLVCHKINNDTIIGLSMYIYICPLLIRHQ